MKTIITGKSGFVGSHLFDYLKKNNHELFSLNLRNQDWVKDFDHNAEAIVHLAGKAHDTKNVFEKIEYFDVNTELTKQLFDVFLDSNLSLFVYFSSVKAVADSIDIILDENVKPNPKTAYGQSKLKAEQYLLSRKMPKDKRLLILRPCMIHGPRNKGNFNLLFNIVKKGIPYPLAKFKNKRSFLCIENLCFLVQNVLENKDIDSGIYNIADDEPLSTIDLVKTVASLINKKQKIWFVPKFLIYFIAKVGDVVKLPLNSERLKKLTENYVVSNHKIKSAIRTNSLPITAIDGLKNTIKNN